MNQSGRVSLLGILGLLSFVLIAGLLFLSRESLNSVGGRFMSALAKGDVDTLTEMSYLGKRSPEEIRKMWTFSTKTAGKYYNFRYRITSARQADQKSGTVTMMFVRDADSPSSYEEKRELPLVKVGEDWKVDVANITRDIYPGLPR
ncbi:MAG: hypothetical protein ACO1SV_06045 [Fimbriimonas sp.]